MTYIIAEPCIDIKDRSCVDVCPVDCFREGPNFLVIDPDECIDCTLCVAECPVEAIFAELDLSTKWRKYAEIDTLWFRDKEKARAMVEAVKVGS